MIIEESFDITKLNRNKRESLSILKRFSVKKQLNKKEESEYEEDEELSLFSSKNKEIQLYDPETVFMELLEVDSTKNKKNLPFICFFWATTLINRKRIDKNLLKEYFDLYEKLRQKGKIESLQYRKKEGVLYQEKPINWLNFTEICDSEKENDVKNIFSDEIDQSNLEESSDILYKDDRYTIFLADKMNKCIKYADLVPVITGLPRPSFCISDKKIEKNMWKTYRTGSHSTFYFIFDKSPNQPDEAVVVLDAQKNNEYSLTNHSNKTGYKSLYTYLSENPVLKKLHEEKDIFKNIPLTKEEIKRIEVFSRPISKEKYKELSIKDKIDYINMRHPLTDEQWDETPDELKNIYLNLKIDLTDYQFSTLNNSMKERYNILQFRKFKYDNNSKGQVSPFLFKKFYETDTELFKAYVNEHSKKIGNVFITLCKNNQTPKFSLVDANTYKIIFEPIIDKYQLLEEDALSIDSFEGYNPGQIKIIIDTKTEKLSGIIDKNGIWFCEPERKYSFVEPEQWFFENYCQFKDINGKYGILKKGGEVVIKPIYNYLSTPTKIDDKLFFFYSNSPDKDKSSFSGLISVDGEDKKLEDYIDFFN